MPQWQNILSEFSDVYDNVANGFGWACLSIISPYVYIHNKAFMFQFFKHQWAGTYYSIVDGISTVVIAYATWNYEWYIHVCV